MQVRPATGADAPAIAEIIMPTIRDGATYALDRDMSEADASGVLDGGARTSRRLSRDAIQLRRQHQ
jgi:hypothetical protein